jgi:hypothetical protein
MCDVPSDDSEFGTHGLISDILFSPTSTESSPTYFSRSASATAPRLKENSIFTHYCFPEGHPMLREAKNPRKIDSTKPEICIGCRRYNYGIAITLTYGGKLFIRFWGF